MINSRKIFIVALALAALSLSLPAVACDNDGDGHKGRNGKRHQASQQVIMPDAYRQACGDCHMAYPAVLLPHRSWVALLDGLDDHFGTVVALDAQQAKDVAAYLGEHAADRAGGKLGRKIDRSVKGDCPTRISEVPYIIREHHEVDSATLRRKNIDGLADCKACHPDAEAGRFDDGDH